MPDGLYASIPLSTSRSLAASQWCSERQIALTGDIALSNGRPLRGANRAEMTVGNRSSASVLPVLQFIAGYEDTVSKAQAGTTEERCF